jgi:hypothetical protein
MTKAEWSGWVQGIGTVLAIAVAIAIPYVQGKLQRLSSRRGHLETIALDVRFAGAQAEVYSKEGAANAHNFQAGLQAHVPAYRVPLHGLRLAVPSLLADGTLSGPDADALAQFYVDATSFNHCLDNAQKLLNAGRDCAPTRQRETVGRASRFTPT